MSEYTIKARPTIYKGIRMRSRTEAKFAAHLDALKIAWKYEPDCFADETGQYVPDFGVQVGDEMAYIEVKPLQDHAVEALAGAMRRIWPTDQTAHLIATYYDETHSEYGEDRWCTIHASQRRTAHEWLEMCGVDVERRDDNLWTFTERYTVPDIVARTVIHFECEDWFNESYKARERGEEVFAVECGDVLYQTREFLPHVDRELRYIVPYWIDNVAFPRLMDIDDDDRVGDTYVGQSFCMSNPLSSLIMDIGLPASCIRRRGKR